MNRAYPLLWTVLCCSTVQAFEFPKHPILAYECETCINLPHEELHDHWAVSTPSLNEKSSNKQRSYSYRQQINAKQLNQGMPIYTRAPGAIVRITPLQNKELPEFSVQTTSHQTMSLKDASSQYSAGKDLAEALGTQHPQLMLQLKKELGSGLFTLQSTMNNKNNTDAYLISIFDKYSSTFLEVESASLNYQYGDKVVAQITLTDKENEISTQDITAVLNGPMGQEIPMSITEQTSNQFAASVVLNSSANDHGTHWYIEVSVDAKTKDGCIKRNAHTAFSYSIPSATLVSIKKHEAKPMTFVATLDVATASRYSVESVLFSENNENNTQAKKPIELAQTGQWLEPGVQQMEFTFDNSKQLSDDNLYLGYLRLIDFGQLKMVDHYNQPIKLTQLTD